MVQMLRDHIEYCIVHKALRIDTPLNSQCKPKSQPWIYIQYTSAVSNRPTLFPNYEPPRPWNYLAAPFWDSTIHVGLGHVTVHVLRRARLVAGETRLHVTGTTTWLMQPHN